MRIETPASITNLWHTPQFHIHKAYIIYGVSNSLQLLVLSAKLFLLMP